MSSDRLSENATQRRGSRSEGRLCSLLKPAYGLNKLETLKPTKVQLDSQKHRSTSSDTSEDETTKDNKKINLSSCGSSFKYEYRRDSQDDSSDSQDTEKQKRSEHFLKNHTRVEHAKETNSMSKNRNKNYKREAREKCQTYSEFQFQSENPKTTRPDVDLFLDTNENSVKKNPIKMSINKENEIDVVQI